jgi:hypothetical protein
MIRHLILICLFSLISNFCYAGIEHELLLEQYNECTIRVTHDATPDSTTGTILFRSFKIEEGIHYPCDINENIASISLNKAFQQYSLLSGLKPVTSIMIGRLIHYPWAKDYLKNNPISKTMHQEFNNTLLNAPIITPFKHGLVNHHYNIIGVSCEKILLNKQGHVTDAMCWLELEETDKK